MICSDCKKNPATIFINKIENGVSTMEGLCHDCAKKRGLDVPEAQNKQSTPSQNNIDMTNMSKQLESLFKDLSANLNNIEDLEKIDPEELEDMSQDYSEGGMGIPIGSIFANFIPHNSQANEEESNNNSRQKVKVEKKKTNKNLVLVKQL